MEKLLALQAKLASGEITVEQFETDAQTLLVTKEINQQEYDERKGSNEGGDDDKPLTRKDVEVMMENAKKLAAQQEGDRVRTEYAKKLADEKKARELLELEKMTADERAKHEKEQYEKTLKDREAALNAREVEIEVGDQLSALQLPLSFKPFFTKSATKEDAQANIKALADVWSLELKTAVETRLKGLGENRSGGGGGTQSAKKWTDLTLTEQGQLLVKDPTEAKRLAAASGITLNI